MVQSAPPIEVRSGLSSRIRSKNSPRRPSRIEYVIASSTPASAKSATTSGPRAGTGAGRRTSRAGGIERAGVTSTGRGGATWRTGRGDGMGFGFALAVRRCVMCVTRPGLAVRARLTAGFLERADGLEVGRLGLLCLAFDRATFFFLAVPRFNRILLLSLQLAAEYQKV